VAAAALARCQAQRDEFQIPAQTVQELAEQCDLVDQIALVVVHIAMDQVRTHQLQDLQEQQPIQTKPKKENDGRGKSTKQFHELCKIYHNEHPDKTYRECLKELSNLNKNKIDI
jgi:pectin methylesterase-like acyl-CoA thioesterase